MLLRDGVIAMVEHSPSEALAVETVVEAESGQWAVYVVVVFADGAVRRRVDVYRTRRLAEVAATWIKRAAERDIPGPING